jgi:hypothetical protein
MNAKFTLAIIALVGIGVFALPSTMSLFAGQHSFYNIDATGNQVPCQKCHGDVKAELSAGNPDASTGTPGPHAAFKCEYCHRIEAGSASGDNAYAVIPYVNSTNTTVRYVITDVADMEAGNLPKHINSTDMFVGSTLAGVTQLHVTNGGKGGNISDIYAGTDAALGLNIGPKNNFKLVSTYYAINGTPKDTNPLTKDGGLRISAATVSSTGVVNLYGAGSKAVNPGSAYHAASLVSCMECHGGEEPMGHQERVDDGRLNNGSGLCADCHYGSGPGALLPNGSTQFRMTTLQAGGFGLTGMADDNGTVEAHKAWVTTDDGINRFGGPNGFANNGACIGCHTHVAMDVTFKKGYSLAFNATETAVGVYSVDRAHVDGDVKVAIYGNGSGATYAVGDTSYTWQSGQAMYVNGASTKTNLVLNNEASDSAAALTN